MTYNVALFFSVIVGDTAAHTVLDFWEAWPDEDEEDGGRSSSVDAPARPGDVCH